MKKILTAFLFALLSGMLAVSYGVLAFRRRVEAEVRELFVYAKKEGGGLVTEEMLQGLPEPVRRYLTYSGVIGKPIVQTARIRQAGMLRTGKEQPWMDFSASEYFSVDPPGFVWDAIIKKGPFPLLLIRDMYRSGQGGMLAKLGGVYPLFDTRTQEITQGALVRYLAEMVLFPSSFLGENIDWEAVDDHSATATLTDSGLSVRGTFTFDDLGRVTNFTAERYMDSGDGKASLETWKTPILSYQNTQGLILPEKIQTVWALRSGDLPVVQMEMLETEYDRPVQFSVGGRDGSA